jgi:NAD(P)-dependent dehydrogenase (short-subunit alcohol dehydrogenase family)
MQKLVNLQKRSGDYERMRVLVTGGGAGIGATIAKYFIASGARVAIVDKDLGIPSLKEQTLPSDNIRLLGDVSDSSSMDNVFDEIDRSWGGIDVVVNNAGISIPASLGDTTLEIWHSVLAVNLTGVFLVSQRAAARMVPQSNGVIINIASVSGMVGMPNYLSYNVSKAGVIELTKTLALELSPNVRVNAICPGYVLTPMQEREYAPEELLRLANKLPAKRLGRPEEIASLAVYLASEEARYITGACLVIDGGESAGGLASF